MALNRKCRKHNELYTTTLFAEINNTHAHKTTTQVLQRSNIKQIRIIIAPRNGDIRKEWMKEWMPRVLQGPAGTMRDMS